MQLYINIIIQYVICNLKVNLRYLKNKFGVMVRRLNETVAKWVLTIIVSE